MATAWDAEDEDEEGNDNFDLENEDEVDSSGNAWLLAGACTACGLRPTNEDQHIILSDWCPGGAVGLFAVFDGHGGPAVAILASKLLARELRAELESEEAGLPRWSSEEGRRIAGRRAFLKLDKQLSSKQVAHSCGSTCVAAAVWPEEEDGPAYRVSLWNIGDSRGVVVRGGPPQGGGATADAPGGTGDASEPARPLVLGETQDHKPDDPAERRRVIDAGGVVTGGRLCPARIDRDLALSRAFGDFRLKDNEALPPERQKVSPEPDFYEFVCRRGDVVVLACDGAFDVYTSRQVAAVARRHLYAKPAGDPVSAARAVVHGALHRGTTDNVSCVVVQL